MTIAKAIIAWLIAQRNMEQEQVLIVASLGVLMRLSMLRCLSPSFPTFSLIVWGIESLIVPLNSNSNEIKLFSSHYIYLCSSQSFSRVYIFFTSHNNPWIFFIYMSIDTEMFTFDLIHISYYKQNWNNFLPTTFYKKL